MAKTTHSVVVALVLALLCVGASSAQAQSVQLGVDSRDIFVDLPFVLNVTAQGFDEDPQPKVSDFTIADAKVTFLGVSPSVSTSLSIINGRRSESKTVSFVYRYRVEPTRAGRYKIPAIEVTQGGRKASSRSAEFSARTIEATQDMRLELSIPDRALWVGETFEFGIDWFLRRDPQQPNFVIPLFDREDLFRVAASLPKQGQRTLPFQVGTRELELPYERSTVQKGGAQFSQFRFRARVTPQKAGTFDLPAAKVVAALQTGVGRDRFGFRTARTGIFRAQAQPAKLVIKPLPQSGKPKGFAGAVGTGFSIEAQASRTVVQVGDPIELTIKVRGDAYLDALRPPELAGQHALDEEKFEIIDAPATGEPTDDGNARLFKISLRLKSTDVREIPALPFSYFNPQSGSYESSRSRPIALSVAGSSVVGAAQVQSGVSKKTKSGAQADNAGAATDADLALSAAGDTMNASWTVAGVLPIAIALYLLPLLAFGWRRWDLKTRDQRGKKSNARKSKKAALEAIEAARSKPAREATGAVLAALKAVATEYGHPAKGEVFKELEIAGYAPEAASSPLPKELLDSARALVESWDREKRPSSAKSGAAALIVIAGLAASTAQAAAPTLDQARQSYTVALGLSDSTARSEAFAKAEREFQSLVQASPDRPELLVDWGNAALGARRFGTAALAYKRALNVDRGNERAQKNLDWLRARAPDDMPRMGKTSAVDTMFFWHESLSPAGKHLLAAAAFFIFGMLLVPWRSGGSPLLRRLAILPLLLCIAMWVSIVMERDASADVVVVADAAVLRVADSTGAQAARPAPLPSGTEGEVEETRGTWVRVALPGGFKGWLQTSDIAFVVPRD